MVRRFPITITDWFRLLNTERTMCGITGYINLDSTQPVDAAALPAMLRAIEHRGPDDEGRLIDGPLAMGMRRLSIIDLADGQQPIYDESGRYGVVFNGEIYNYRELRADLISRGHKFRTQSDTEVLVHLFEESGPACVDELRGMFAFAIWDSQDRELFIARDRMGIKPLYYTERNGRLYFASEIKSLLTHHEVSAQLDHRALSEYLSLKYVPAPRTMFAGIASLPPAHSLTVRRGSIETRQYWDVSFAKPDTKINETEAVEELLRLLRESVRLRLRADVPFGAFLSGGVDSSTIVALMSEFMTEPVKAFSVGFDQKSSDGQSQDELPYARQVAEQFGCEHHTLLITADDFLNHAESVLFHLDQPIADQATVATHMVAKLAREHVKMVLTGEGGDELFAGYARYEAERFSPWFAPLRPLRRPICAAASRLPGLRRAKIALSALTIGDEATRYANWFPLMNDDAKSHLLASTMHPYAAGTAANFRKLLAKTDATSPLDRMLYADSKLWLVDYLLLRGDKLTMANSLEARVPLLDHHLVEFAAKLPPNFKIKGKQRKYLLKQAAGRLIPDEIINRPKQGFPIPIEKWLRGPARPMMRDLLSPDTIARRGLFESQVVERLMKQHESGYADFSTELWGLMSFEMWMQRFVDGEFSSPPVDNAAASMTGAATDADSTLYLGEANNG